ncbi:type I-U CRISPR-associated protein Cas5/Cas6 [Amycolatopsis rhizosphaerae]|uniref:Type I-U CRISPR-associated protein Cas5/Cas6 n=1 Tax=Amycolatopsis rhizosphaerae TaxID=2053003 RepID=A0A558CJB4_9PSEU|nr:type I-U CRISPR-associated protein Csb2 [Amycolatopsis rhizosphaerae]TVT48869.1 type I-U CRISPR-associated protein Cas5/Cas6 [Amycolatopsis rhizosphaerae]
MTTTLVIRFPWGRYHATPWGRHVNEGAVELPPSPWRVLRALYAVWQTRVPDLDEHIVHGLLDELSKPPTVFVPPHEIAHTRHYYPDSRHTLAGSSVDRTLDAFAVVDRDAKLVLQWRSLDLDPPQQDALAKLAMSLPYLGRADSICEAEVVDQWEPEDHEVWEPVDVAEFIPENAEIATVLAPERPLDLAALVARPVDVRKGGLLFPAGTKFLAYQQRKPASRVQRRRPNAPVTAVRFAIAQRVHPPQADALIYTDLLRRAALSKLGGLRSERSESMLGGKTAEGSRARDNHQHAHYLPLFDESKHLDGLLVWIPGGLGGDELEALTRVTSLRAGTNDKWRLTLRATEAGDVRDLAPQLTGPSRLWHSVTPFTPSRYRKKRDWHEFLRSELERELSYRGLGVEVAELRVSDDPRFFRRNRPSSPERVRPSAFVSVRLNREVAGPLPLGHLSHFGLGLFIPR